MSKRGFSLIEMTIGLAVLGVMATGTMTLFQNMNKASANEYSKMEFLELAYEVRSILRDPNDCSASFKDVEFKGSTIANNFPDVELWRTDQAGVPVQLKFTSSEDESKSFAKKYGNLSIKTLRLKMPYYTDTSDFPEGGYSYKAQLELVVSYEGLEKSYIFDDLVLAFQTSSNGTSVIDTCVKDSSNTGLQTKLAPIEILLDSESSQWKCTNMNVISHCGDSDGCRFEIFMQHQTHHWDQVRAIEEFLYFEQNDLSKNNKAGIYGYTRQFGEGEYSWLVGTTAQYTLFKPWEWIWAENYHHAKCFSSGGTSSPGSLNPYQIYFRVHPNVKARIIIHD